MAPPFESDNALQSWLHERCLGHLSRVSLATLTPRIEAPYLPQARLLLARRRLVELLTRDGLARWEEELQPSPRMRRTIPALAWAYVEAERLELVQTMGRVDDRLQRPLEPRTHPVYERLLALRETFGPHLAPRPEAALASLTLHVEVDPPGLRLRDSTRSVQPVGSDVGYILAEARLAFVNGEASLRCNCGGMPCVHGLALVDAALLWLHQPWSEAFGETIASFVTPPWERALRAMELALEEAGDPEGQSLTWRVDVLDGFGVEVLPYVHRRNRRGQRSAGTRVTRRKLMQEHAALLSAQDARIAALLPEANEPATEALLNELVDHPGLVLEEDPGQAVSVDRAQVGIVAQTHGAGLRLTLGVDGTALPGPLLERMRRARPGEAHYLWERGGRRLTVLELSRRVRALLPVLHRHGDTFPPESHPALLQQLSSLAARVPVSMPRSVLGEERPPEQRPVLRFEGLLGGAVRVEVLVRALEGGPIHRPGEGPRDVHVRHGERAIHSVRDFARELEVARAVRAQLPWFLAEADEDWEFGFRFPSPIGALEVLSAGRRLDPAPELEWVDGAPRLLGRHGPGALKVVLERKREWFGVMGGLSVDGERVELARLLEAARRRERFVEVAGRGFIELDEALRAHLERLSDHVHAARHGLEIGPSALQTMSDLGDAGAEVASDAHWRDLVGRMFAARELDPSLPADLRATLRDYQRDGFAWLSRLAAWGAGGVLADDMGLGKTVQSLAVLLQRAALGPQLVLAPTSVAFNWQDEARRFAPSLRFHLFADAPDRGGLLDRLGPGDVLVVSYGLLTRDLARLREVRFATLVFDEAQALKNAQTQRFRAARALQGDFRFALSGTPLENDLGELWSLFSVVFPTLLGSREAFRKRYAAPIERKVDPTAGPALARVLQPFLLRRTKAQVEKELPPRTDVLLHVELSAEEWAQYEDARLAALSDLQVHKPQLKEQEKRILILSALTRLRLLASHPRLTDPTSTLGSAKLERLLLLVETLIAEGQRALVFSQFTSHLSLVREALDARGIAYAYLDGQTPQAARAERVRGFQEGDAPLFLISLKAGGFGLNLTAATSVIHLDPWWNPAVEDQASDRAHRLGQTRPVTIYRLVSRGTIEEQMLSLHRHKRELVEGVLEGKDAAGRLSSSELLGLLARQLVPEQGEMESPEPTRH